MIVSPALAVAFAVKEGAPSDVRAWVSTDLAEYLISGRRGFVVITETLEQTPNTADLASWVREIIANELRRQYQQPADVALGRAFAAANGALHERIRELQGADAAERLLVGASALVVEGATATLAHVPPGQVILIEDDLVYAIPDLESWSPYYADAASGMPTPEPLGFGPRVAPVIAQTDLRPGDTLILCTAKTGKAIADRVLAGNGVEASLALFHGRDPDRILDSFRDAVADAALQDAAVTVLGFAPLPDSRAIRTLGDVGRRAGDSLRAARGALAFPIPGRPVSPPTADAATAVEVTPDDDAVLAPDGTEMAASPAVAAEATPDRRSQWRARTLRVAEKVSPQRDGTWAPSTYVQQFGVPGAHGVESYRGVATVMGEDSWRTRLPRLPIRRSVGWAFLCLLLVAALLLATGLREHLFTPEGSYLDNLVQVDRSIQDAQGMTDADAINRELVQAQRQLDAAAAAGAPADAVDVRQRTITAQLDTVNHVLRVSNVTRIGGLPDELKAGATRLAWTPGGLFLADGSLYLLQPDGKVIDRVLAQGSTVPGTSTTVGHLFNVAYDTDGLYTTDGVNLFVYGTDNAWHVVAMSEINDQGPWQPAPIGAFSSNVYILESDYRNIYRFNGDPSTPVAAPSGWVQAGDRELLGDAVDMAIDGNIYVVLDSGEVLTFFRGSVSGRVTPSYIGDGKVVAITNGAATGYLYVAVVDGNQGKIIAFDKTGEYVYQLELPSDFTTGGLSVKQPFEGLQDFVVDENSGTIYLVNGDAVWSANYELPPLPNAGGTPVAESTPAAPVPAASATPAP
ncbi:MAG: hypothetical protein ACTHQE_16295 [Thermomicrobiales bacterium]